MRVALAPWQCLSLCSASRWRSFLPVMLHLACSPALHPPSRELLHIPGSMGNPVGKGADGVTAILQLFKGKFYHCLGVDIRNITNRSDCVAANYKWVHHKYNFDNLGQVSVPAAPVSGGSPAQGLSPPIGTSPRDTDAVLGKPDPWVRRDGYLAWVPMQKLCHYCVGIRVMLTGCGGKKSGGSKELDFLFPPATKQMFFTTSLPWWVWLHMASCPPSLSSTGEGAGFDVCRDTGRKSISMLCVLERKPMIFFSPACQMHLLHICFALCVAGSDVPLCSGFQGWLGQYYV